VTHNLPCFAWANDDARLRASASPALPLAAVSAAAVAPCPPSDVRLRRDRAAGDAASEPGSDDWCQVPSVRTVTLSTQKKDVSGGVFVPVAHDVSQSVSQCTFVAVGRTVGRRVRWCLEGFHEVNVDE
jgi:hypothetical protein